LPGKIKNPIKKSYFFLFFHKKTINAPCIFQKNDYNI